MINTLVQLIVIMPYNHSYDRQLLIPVSFECFSLFQLHKVDGANAPAFAYPSPYLPPASSSSVWFMKHLALCLAQCVAQTIYLIF